MSNTQRDLEAELTSLRLKTLHLEDELDAVSMAASRVSTLEAENMRLQELVASLTTKNTDLLKILSVTHKTVDDYDNAYSKLEDISAPFVVPGTWDSIECITTLNRCNQNMNVLCVRCHPIFPKLIAIGGANKSIVFVHVDLDGTSTQLAIVAFDAPILSMDFSPTHSGGLLAAGLMDGSSHVLTMLAKAGQSSSSVGECSFSEFQNLPEDVPDTLPTFSSSIVRVISSFKDHSKYVVSCRWSRDGSLFATGSHDKSVALYKVSYTNTNNHCPEFRQLTKLYLKNAVESVEFVGSKVNGEPEKLVISVREEWYLTYVDLTDGKFSHLQVSINENSWDLHVSFSIMSLVASPSGKYLLAATDKGRIIIYRAGQNSHVRTLVGHFSDPYFQPKAAWSADSKFVICNSEGANTIFVYCLASSKVVERIAGHTGVVRDLYAHPSTRIIYTASYDKSVKLFKY